MPKLFLLNALITPFKGVRAEFSIEKVTGQTARIIFLHRKSAGFEIVSALGHEAAVQCFKIILGSEFSEIKMNRITVEFERNDEGLALSLRSRVPEGKILSLEEMEQIGYDIYHVKRLQ